MGNAYCPVGHFPLSPYKTTFYTLDWVNQACCLLCSVDLKLLDRIDTRILVPNKLVLVSHHWLQQRFELALHFNPEHSGRNCHLLGIIEDNPVVKQVSGLPKRNRNLQRRHPFWVISGRHLNRRGRQETIHARINNTGQIILFSIPRLI